MKKLNYSEFNDNIRKEIHEKYDLIAGIDEVGRGPLAGPVVTCAIIMKKDSHINGVTDSKKLSKKKMKDLSPKIIGESVAYAFGYANNILIDKENIKNATKIAMKDALEKLEIRPEIVLIDAERIETDIKQLNIVKGDLYEYSISCASILAKLRRDKIMENFAKIYPYYSFETNAGYGTKKHYEGLEKYGECPIHRKTFLRKFKERQLSFL
ncbi:ribonuclease HII [Anaerococcus sp. AGMB00486]|uniref:Ribonuclease HII n=2 Tax=Anaerococcus TaxID=165779 RepID=A0ABX2N9J6_9FIRM|nr:MULTISPECIES: ribonuclease HII [Anaerococcus]MDY3006783.1 ribonuclease HII [Anaerococcus porci]MSS78499.1 ribonuclease HII [Anaerococcus porci]NVF11356.1 ribonuclease HII [Anaerococcus faecalis]